MSDLNSVSLVGRLVRDPELRYTPQGAPVCEFTLASNRRFAKKDGEKADEVVFVDVVVWNRLAEISAEYLKKGRQVGLVGQIIQDRWEDKESGKKRSKIRIQAQILQFLGGGSKDEEASTPEVPVPVEPAPVATPPAPQKSVARKAPVGGKR